MSAATASLLPPPPPWAATGSGDPLASSSPPANTSQRLSRLVRMIATMSHWEEGRAAVLAQASCAAHPPSPAAHVRRRTRQKTPARQTPSQPVSAEASDGLTITAFASKPSAPADVTSLASDAEPRSSSSTSFEQLSDAVLLDQAEAFMTRIWAHRWASSQHTARLAAASAAANSSPAPRAPRGGRADPVSPFALTPSVADENNTSPLAGKSTTANRRSSFHTPGSTPHAGTPPYDPIDSLGDDTSSSKPPSLMPIPSQMLGGESPTTVMRDLELAYVPTDGEDEEHDPLPKLSAEEELRLLKAQVQDIARVCKVRLLITLRASMPETDSPISSGCGVW